MDHHRLEIYFSLVALEPAGNQGEMAEQHTERKAGGKQRETGARSGE